MTISKVLIVDDDRDVADTLAIIIEHSGYDVTVAYDGHVAVACAEKHDFDYAFIDIMMPEMDGVEVLARIRKLQPQLSTYMMTGYSAPELRARALEEGALDVMSKPVMPEDVLGKLTEVSPGTILIVDDDPIFAEIVSSTLQMAGWNVRTAENGLQAVDVAARGGIAALILDVQMPILSGVEVTAELRRRNVEIPTLVVSSSKYAKQIFDGYDVQGFMRKPVDPRALLDFVERQIRSQSVRAA